MKPQASKRIEFKIGFFLMSVYILTSYIAVDVTISSSINSLALYAFLAWGMLTAVLYGLQKEVPFYTVWYLVFMLVSILIMTYSPEFSILSGSFYLMLVTFFVTYFIQLFVTDEQDFEKLCWIYAFSSFALILMLQFTGNLVGSESERLGGEFMGNANTFASVIMLAVLLEIWLLIYRAKTAGKKVILLSMISYNMFALALSAGRKFFLMPFIFLYILLFFKADKNGRRNAALYTIIIAILGIGVYTMMMKVPVLYESIGVRMEHLIEGQQDESKLDGSARIRDIIRKDAIEQWTQKPIVGYGFDSYKYRAQRVVGHFYYSHCNFTEMLYNGGIVYFVIYYWIFYKLIRDCHRKKDLHQRYKSFIYAIVFSLFILDYGSVSYNVTSHQILLALACKALSFDTVKEESEEKGNGQD